MEANEQNLSILKNLLQNTLSPDQKLRKDAEIYLTTNETQAGFIIVILHLISKLLSSQDLNDKAIRLAAAVLFKNSVKRNWYITREDEPNKFINENDRAVIKTHVIDLMCTAPSDIQRQLAEAVTIISKYDFPKKWTNLLPQLVSKLSSNDIYINKGVMLTANSIMKKFRNVAKSDELFSDIIVCLQEFHNPLLQMYQLNSKLIQASTNLIDLENLFETHRLMTRIFYSLNWLDLPEIFEDNMEAWMNEFLFYLTYKNNLLITTNIDIPGPLEKLQAAIIENLNLYASKYDEEFNIYLSSFTQAIWQLLIQVITIDSKYDILATNAIKFLTSIASKARNINLFNEVIIKDIIENIIIRNIIFVDNDEDLFNNNPIDYIRKDIEDLIYAIHSIRYTSYICIGSDNDSRRRCSIELIRSLLKHFNNYITTLCQGYIKQLLDNYYINPAINWKSKDTAIHLFLSISIISQSSNSGNILCTTLFNVSIDCYISLGALTLNTSINIIEFFTNYIIPDLHDNNINNNPIIKADVIKLICIYRIQFPINYLLELLPHVIKFLNSDYIVISTYAAYTIEKFLTIKDKDPNSNNTIVRITKEHIKPYAQALLSNLFSIIDNHDENDYVMKCIMRVIYLLNIEIINYMNLLLTKLTVLLSNVCKNPMNPYYNHYLFESIALLVKTIYLLTLTNTDINIIIKLYNELESFLFPSFQYILTQDIIEFIPYVFQILAQLLSSYPTSGNTGLSNSYRSLLPPLLTPAMWERKGNVPALIDLLKAYISVGMNEIIASNHLVGILGIFQKLLASKLTEVYAFSLLVSIIQHNSYTILSSYFSTIFNLLLIRMQDQIKNDNKTPKYCKHFLHFLTLFCVVYDCEKLNDILESLTPGLLCMIILNVWSHNIQLCCSLDKIEIKQMIVGSTKLLVSPIIANRSDVWIAVLNYILQLISAESGKSIVDVDDLTFIDEEAEAREFDSTYSKLLYATLPPPVSSVEIAAASSYFIKSLSVYTTTYPGKYINLIQTGLETKQMNELQELLQLNGVTLM